ncbi:hypothetical protein HaLaN_23447 [Haematococcus lacustris]|uniref:Uncharacterized protein n=1 Tax=Haematococcus lacustris TaxID=44745 RepID=A0A699ZS43_HAELA|nr:hypothetical protein HaLaN_23447 [Haematococcus lacustris]
MELHGEFKVQLIQSTSSRSLDQPSRALPGRFRYDLNHTLLAVSSGRPVIQRDNSTCHARHIGTCHHALVLAASHSITQSAKLCPVVCYCTVTM